MKILDRYIIKELFIYLGICLSVFAVIYLIIDLFQKIDDFIEAKVPGGVIIRYFFYKLPFIIVQMLPVAMLISTIVVYSLMKKNKELIALQTSGIGIKRISLPAIGMGLLMVAISFILSELLVPYTSSKAEMIWNRDVRKGKYKRFFRRRHIWYKGKDSIYCIDLFNGKDKVMERAVFYFFDKKFNLVKRIQAKKVLWTSSGWIAKDVVVQIRKAKGRGYEINRLESMKINIAETPESFLRPVRRPEEMNYWQLKRFAHQIEKEGYDAKRYFVEVYIKLSFPFINIVVVLIGIAASLKMRTESIPISISVGILICFLYMVLMGIFRSLGIAGVVPPFISAWMTNIIFLLLAIHMMLHLEK